MEFIGLIALVGSFTVPTYRIWNKKQVNKLITQVTAAPIRADRKLN
jgi:hypothetical protein